MLTTLTPLCAGSIVTPRSHVARAALTLLIGLLACAASYAQQCDRAAEDPLTQAKCRAIAAEQRAKAAEDALRSASKPAANPIVPAKPVVRAASGAAVPAPAAAQASQPIKDCDVCPEMVVIPAGIFSMGSSVGEADEQPVRTVSVASFAMGRFEVTKEQWRSVMGSDPISLNGCLIKCPVDNIGWDDAKAYIKQLNLRTNNRYGYRLPSEAEWEYAARGGTTTAFSSGNKITTDQANFDGNETYNGSFKGAYLRKTTPVGSYPANQYGLHDMHGNVWEWVEDCWNENYERAPTNGEAWTKGDCRNRVHRGGSWDDRPNELRSSARAKAYTAGMIGRSIGLRLVTNAP